MIEKIKELEKEIKDLKEQEQAIKYEDWNKKAEEFVANNQGSTYKNSLYFPNSKETNRYWVYKISGIDKTSSPYTILKHKIYISDLAQSFELNTEIYSSCAYITHGMQECEEQEWEDALEEFIRLSKVSK